MQAVDEAIKDGIDLDGTPIPPKMLELYNRIMNEENKRERSGVKKSMRNRCVKTGSKHFDKETLDRLLIIGFPPTVIFPWSGLLLPCSKLNNVDFPAPLGPTRAVKVPGSSLIETLFKAGGIWVEKEYVRFSAIKLVIN